MTKDQFSKLVNLADQTELVKATLVGFYLHIHQELEEYSLRTLVDGMVDFGLSRPNEYRLRDRMKGNGSPFIKGKQQGNYKLSIKQHRAFKEAYPTALVESEEIVTDETILPDSLLKGTRTYLEKVGQQINGSRHYKIADGCLLLMRRMLEMLILLAYEHKGREAESKDASGWHYPLSHLINHAQSNQIIRLTRASSDVLEELRQLGNNSAHGGRYIARLVEIDKSKIAFRVCVEELLHECGLR